MLSDPPSIIKIAYICGGPQDLWHHPTMVSFSVFSDGSSTLWTVLANNTWKYFYGTKYVQFDVLLFDKVVEYQFSEDEEVRATSAALIRSIEEYTETQSMKDWALTI